MSEASTLQRARNDAGTRAVVFGGMASGLGAYAFTILGARVLGEHDYAPVGVLWTIQYLVLTVGFLSLEAYVTRTGRVTNGAWRWIAGVVVALAAVCAVFSVPLFGDRSVEWPLSAALLAFGFGTYVLARGMAASEGRFSTYGIMTGGESLVRLAIAAMAMMILPTAGALALTLPAGAIAMTAWWLWRRKRVPPAAQQGGEPLVPELDGTSVAPFLASTTLANAIAQALLAGGPLVTSLLGARPALTSSVFVTTTSARAPLVLLYSGLLARILPPLRQEIEAGATKEVWRRIAKAIRLGTVAFPLIVGAGWLLGPPLVAIAFGEGLRPSPFFAALTAAAVFLATWALLANQVLIALDRPASLAVPWVVALAAAGPMLLLPADLAIRAGAATAVGLAVAVVLVTVTIAHRVRP